MCRLLAFSVRGEIDKEIVNSFINAAKNDVYFKYGSHSHGWGITAIVWKSGRPKVIYYKSVEPIYEDETFTRIIDLLKGDKISGIIHARKAGKDFLIGLRHNHPYHIKTQTHDLYFAHNGSINRKAFQNPSYPSTDSYLFFLEIVNRLDKQEIRNAYRDAVNALKDYATSLNSALLSYNDYEGDKIFIAYYYNKARMREMEEYYKLYRYENYIFSSTVNYYLGKKGEELEFNTIYEIY